MPIVLGDTVLADVSEQIKKYWAPMTQSQLVQTNKLVNVINRDYEGSIAQEGDTVYVSMIKPMVASLKTIGTDADTYSPSKIQTVRTAIVCDKVVEASVRVGSLVELQSQIQSGSAQLRETMVQAMSDALNAYLYTFIKSSVSNGTTGVTGCAAFTKAELRLARVYAGQKKWRTGNWFGFMDPSYWGDMNIDDTLAKSNFVSETPISAPSEFRNLLGFNLTEDNCLSTDQALFFHRDWLYFVMQQGANWKVSDLHAQEKRGIHLSCEMVVGAKKNVFYGDDLHFPVYNSAWTAPTV